MDTFRGLRKTTLKRIARSRGLSDSGTVEKLKSRLSQYETPFSIDYSQPQEEIVLSLVDVPNTLIRNYLIKFSELREQEINPWSEKVYLLETLLGEELNPTSIKIIQLGYMPISTLQRQSGRVGEKVELIRRIIGLTETESSFIERLKNNLESLGFSIITAPAKRTPLALEVENFPLDAKTVRTYLEEGYDSSYFPDYLLEEVVNEDLLFKRPVNVRAFARRMVTDPLNYAWNDVKPLLENKTVEDIQLLAQSYGYEDELTINELEFLFQRGYLRKHKPSTYDLPEIMIDLLRDQMDLETFEEIKALLTPEAKERLTLFSEWMDYDDEQLQQVAHGYDIELPYPNTREYFEDDLFNYANISEDNITIGAEDLEVFSDAQLLLWCPTLPYGRKDMIKAFLDYWDDEKIIFVDGMFYQFFNWGEYETLDEIDFETLGIEELRNLLPYLKGSEFEEDALNAYVQEITLNVKITASEEIQNILRIISNAAIAYFGGATVEKWTNNRRPPNIKLAKEYQEILNDALGELSDPDYSKLEEWRAFSLLEMEEKDLNIIQMLEEKPSSLWIETSFYYYAKITSEALVNNPPFVFRKN